MNVTVLGAGAWGTALATVLQRNEQDVTLWGHDAARLEEVRRNGRNERYLPGIQLPPELKFENELERAVDSAEVVVVAIPSKAFREVASLLKSFSGIAVSVTKGIEHDTGLTMSGVLAETAPQCKPCALSGPTFAIEVAKQIPTAIVGASRDLTAAAAVQQIFHRPAFRVYTSVDVLGVELGGALKNVVAIAAGICDGIGFGDNSKAALVTRAISEIRRLGVACGAHIETFTGLSGLGDLMVTCFSKLSRNRAFGERIGRGEKAADIAASTLSVAEGYPTTRSAYRLAQQHKIVTPIIDEVHAMLYEKKSVKEALEDLMARELKAED
jgi:glycerol-3-phosphate dehydrogenase (NAD(P)+)